MSQRSRVEETVEVRERAARLVRQASETSNPWFAEQLRQLAQDLAEYADTLELEALQQR